MEALVRSDLETATQFVREEEGIQNIEENLDAKGRRLLKAFFERITYEIGETEVRGFKAKVNEK